MFKYYPVRTLPEYPDASPYTTGIDVGTPDMHVEPQTLNIGWLGLSTPFPTAAPLPALCDVLWHHCLYPIFQLRGLPYPCPLCQQARYPIEYACDDKRLILGTAEIRVLHPDGRRFACPDLIYHFVVDHAYAMPAALQAGLRYGLEPGSAAFAAIIKDTEKRWMEAMKAWAWQRDYGDAAGA